MVRGAYDGAQDFDLALRLVERAHKIRHIPRVLYHWRQHAQSTSMNPKAKPYAHEAGFGAVSDAVARLEIWGSSKMVHRFTRITFAVRLLNNE